MENTEKLKKDISTKDINNINEYQNDNNININENLELEEIKNELEAKNNEILSLQNDVNFYKEKNEELNLELDKIKSLIINNDIKDSEINNLRKEIELRDNQIQLINEENIELKNNIKNLTDFIVSSLTPLGITIPELSLINENEKKKGIDFNNNKKEKLIYENFDKNNIINENNNNINNNLNLNDSNISNSLIKLNENLNDSDIQKININENVIQNDNFTTRTQRSNNFKKRSKTSDNFTTRSKISNNFKKRSKTSDNFSTRSKISIWTIFNDPIPLKKMIFSLELSKCLAINACTLTFGFLLSNTYRSFGIESNLDEGGMHALSKVFTAINTVSRILWGLICQKFKFKKPYYVIVLTQIAVGSSLYYSAKNLYIYFIVVCLGALSYSGHIVFFPNLIYNKFGVDNSVILLGICGIFSGIAVLIGPILTYFVNDLEDYFMIYILAVSPSIVSLILTIFIKLDKFSIKPKVVDIKEEENINDKLIDTKE